jgi:hypothetical protein
VLDDLDVRPIAVLLVESSIFQKVKVGKRGGEESSDEDDESGSW